MIFGYVLLDPMMREAVGWSGSVDELGKKHGLSRSSVYRLTAITTESPSVC
jgi:hypothetical protein